MLSFILYKNHLIVIHWNNKKKKQEEKPKKINSIEAYLQSWIKAVLVACHQNK